MSEEIGDFRGARKITSLNCYPLEYHKNEEQLRKDMIERGKKFVKLSGVHYKSHNGMAYYKKKKSIIKVNINGRIMIDASIHRRINPNYPISHVRPKDNDLHSDGEMTDDDSCSDSDAPHQPEDLEDFVSLMASLGNKKRKQLAKLGSKLEIKTATDKDKVNGLDSKTESGDGDSDGKNTPEEDKNEKKIPEFTDEEYLIASPVVLGFAFAEKLWLEFTVSSVSEIQWNDAAWSSLVLEPKTKDIVKVR
jgi:hypothetical protein